MEIDIPDESNESGRVMKENGFHLYPVSVHDEGEGLPYAPINWPNPGDNWGWRVGKRVAVSGYFMDRYLYLPSRFQHSARGKSGFASKLSVEQYVRKEFPNANIDAFFASFSWKIPSKKVSDIKGNEDEPGTAKLLPDEITEHLGSNSQFGTGGCKAGNKMCSRDSSLEIMVCNMCCSEPGFCRNCCCILCCGTINWNCGGYSFIKCKGMIGEGFICGHIAHIECGLRSYMAGTVGGSIGLDAEYYCRRCDTRTDLVSHVSELLQTCQSIESSVEIEKILSTGVCLLRGSQKTNAKMLLHRIELIMTKLKRGTDLEDLWKMEDTAAVTSGITDYKEPLDLANGSSQVLSGIFDRQMESLLLEDEVDRVVHALRKSQESEYIIAEERLNAQKTYILNLYEQLEEERSELSRKLGGERSKHSRRTSSTDPDSSLDVVLKRVDQIKREVLKLKDMEKVAKGFGKTSKEILKEHFGVEVEP